MKFTTKSIEKIITARQDRIVTEDAPKGSGKLALRVRGNLAEWMFLYYTRIGQRRFIKLGNATMSLAEARAAVEPYRKDVLAGLDPKVEAEKRLEREQREVKRRSERGTVEELFAEYVDDLRRRGKSSWPTVNRALLVGRYAAVDLLGPDRKAADITALDIKTVLRQFYARGAKSMAHHLRGYLESAFQYGIKHENDYTRTGQDILFAIEANPVKSVPVDKEARQVGERVLTPEEINRAWYDMPRYGATEPIHRAIQMILAVGGQRVREICEARVEEFDLGRRLWTIPKTRTKNGRQHVVPLTDLAAGLVAGLLDGNVTEFLFPNGRDPERPMTFPALGQAVTRYCKRAGVEHWTPRDIRRTCRTMLADHGEPGYRLDVFLNHGTTVGVGEKHYEHAQRLADKAVTMSKWDAILSKLLGLRPGKVLAFPLAS